MAIIVSLFTCVAPSHRDQPYRVTSPDMNGSIKFALDETDRLVSLLAVDFPMEARVTWAGSPNILRPNDNFKPCLNRLASRSEEHTSELQSLMRNSYAVFCFKKKNTSNNVIYTT